MKPFLFPVFVLSLLFCFGQPAVVRAESWDSVQARGELRWGGDAAGGAPYVFPDSEDPNHMVGFEVDIMDAVAKKLGVKAVFVNVPWDQLVPALLRQDFDIAFNGLEITKNRLDVVDFTVPYYFFSEQITVRKENNTIQSWDDLAGKRVGTLSASYAQNLLEQNPAITAVTYPGQVEPYRDLDIGRVDAVLLDVPIAAFYVPMNPNLKNVGATVGEGIYAGAVRKDSPELLAKINSALAEMIRSGELEAIYRKWNLWNARQEKLAQASGEAARNIRGKVAIAKYFPLLLKGAAVTVVLSFLSMALAVVLGFGLCLAKLYGNRPVRIFANSYIEIIRGTPLLIQLYLLYYGLPNLGIQLNALTAAILGLGMNYSAYEAEIYRAGLLAVAKGQQEAARCLGMSGWQTLRFVIIPQAVRTVLPPSTNDFIALFKDTSLVSIITVMELTRAYSQAATTTYRFLELGLLTALLYFLMSFPLSLWSRAMERKRHVLAY